MIKQPQNSIENQLNQEFQQNPEDLQQTPFDKNLLQGILNLATLDQNNLDNNNNNNKNNLTQNQNNQQKQNKNAKLLNSNRGINKIQQQVFITLEKILNQKSFQQRTIQQNLILNTFFNKNIFLKSLSEHFGNQFVKGILKTAKIVKLQKNKVLVQQGQPALYSFLILDGQIGLTLKKVNNQKYGKNPRTTPTLELLGAQLHSKEEIIEKITAISRIQGKSIKRSIKFQSSQAHNTISSTKSGKQTPVLGTIDWDHQNDGLNQKGQQNWIQKLSKNQQFGLKSRCLNKFYINTAISLQNTLLLQINILHFMHNINLSMSQKLKQQKRLIKNISCFKAIPDEKQEDLLYMLVHKKLKRNDLVYRQGDPSTHFFILLEGEIKLTKDTNIFLENPNLFYMNRRSLVTPPNKMTGIVSRNKPVLPYAQLTNLYNYRPMNKMIEIGVISPVCLFGQQEMVQGKVRQTNAVCISQFVSYYEIQFKKIQELLGKQLMTNFLNEIKSYDKKKVLNRQDRYANYVQMENQKNLTTFYYDGEKQSTLPRKFNIQKINERIQPRFSLNLKENLMKSQQFPPEFTAFNFHKMNSNQKYKKLKKLQKLNVTQGVQKRQKSKILYKEKNKNNNNSRLTKQDNDQQQQQTIGYKSDSQRKIVDISHTWSPIKTQVKRQLQISRKISPVKPSISLKAPLFEPKYFYDVQLKNKRIQRQFKVKKLSLGQVDKKRLLKQYGQY